MEQTATEKRQDEISEYLAGYDEATAELIEELAASYAEQRGEELPTDDDLDRAAHIIG